MFASFIPLRCNPMKTLQENAPIKYNIIISFLSQATDGDSGRNGEIHYKITSGETSLFSIGKLTGDLESRSPVNLENSQHQSQYTLEITAYNPVPYTVLTYTNNTATVTINVQVWVFRTNGQEQYVGRFH